MESTMGKTPLGVGPILRQGASWHGDAKVVTYKDGSVVESAFKDVAIRASRLAGGLMALGVRGDARVGTLLWNNQTHLEAYLAVPAMGAVLHSANLRLFPDQLAFTINMARDEIMIVDPDLVPQLMDVLPALTTVKTVVVNGETIAPQLIDSALRTLTYSELLELGDDDFAWPDVDEDSAATLCFTTGTTGDPKGVAYSHRSIALQCLSAATMNALRLGAEDRALIAVPMFHATAWAYPYAAFWFGADMILPSRHLDPQSLIHLVESQRVTFANGVPTVWSAVMAELKRNPKRDLSTLNRICLGGAVLSEALFDAYAALNIDLIQGWGMTETSPLVSLARPDAAAGMAEQRAQALSQGRILAGVEARLTDPETGTILPNDGTATGEIELRGPWVTSSYLDGVGEDRFVDGWLRTGDIGTIDPKGFVRLTDRSKDIIKSGGEWISSVGLENAISSHPALIEAAVIGVPDERWDERPCAIVVVADGAKVTVEELRLWLEGKVAKWWIPERWIVVPEIPRTSVGKVDKRVLRTSYQSGGLSQVMMP
jgi:fatty-acyl-CoA synthase